MINDYHFVTSESMDTVVGDEKQTKFYPRAKLKKWDNEVNFSVGVITEFEGVHARKDGIVSWDDEHGTTARFYDVDAETFEFEVILSKKPTHNVVELSIETKGLDFHYQPALTKDEIKEGHIRPDNVVGSYAVYHKTMSGDYSAVGGKNYQTGKAFHIFRPHITDAKNMRVWGDLHVDVKRKRLTITVPQKFLNNASYPITVDPTFGKTAIGGSSSLWSSAFVYGAKATSGGAGTATKLTAYGYYSSSNIKGGLYKQSDNSLVGSTSEVAVPTSYAWVDIPFTGSPSITAIGYWLFYQPSNAFYMKYDVVSASAGYSSHTYANAWDDPISFTSYDDLASLYCTYSTPTPVPVFMHHYNQLRRG